MRRSSANRALRAILTGLALTGVLALFLGPIGARGESEVDLELTELVLEDGDDTDAAVDGVAETHVGLVGKGIDGVLSLVRAQLVEELGDVAGPEDLVDVRELLRLVRGKVRGEDAVRLALPAEELARRAW